MKLRSVFISLLALFWLLQPVVGAHETVTKQTEKRPLGDGKTSRTPKAGYVMACNDRFHGGGGAHRTGEWVKDGYWYPQLKPTVPGHVLWPNAKISISLEPNTAGAERVVRANNLPTHATGQYPIPTDSQAYQYDRNPNAVTEQTVLLRLAAQPQIAAQPSCVPMGMIGFAVSGTAIFNAFDLAGRDAPAYEIQDNCNGHPEIGGTYHYHDWSSCLPKQAESFWQKQVGSQPATKRVYESGAHGLPLGFMLDGFPIYGLNDEQGAPVTNNQLDACHGHTHEVWLDAQRVLSYHYHFTREYPYTIGCFKGAVDAKWLSRKPMQPPPHPPHPMRPGEPPPGAAPRSPGA